RREALHKASVRLSNQLDRLTQAYLQEVIPLAEYQRRRHDLEQKQQGVQTQQQQLEVQVDRQGELAAMVTSIEAFCQRVRIGLADATFEQKRTLVELLIDRVLVANGDVEIRYAIPTAPRGETSRFCQLRKDYFHDVIQIFALPERTAWWELPLLLQCLESRRIGRVLINGDNAGGGGMGGPEGLAEETFGGFGVARLTKEKVDGAALGVDRPIEVVPFFLNLVVCLVNAVRVVRLHEMRATPFVEFRRITLHSPKDGGV